jgi:alpha-D-ribose 1-methylphosphonate 5-triphosphate diphosphatase
VISLRAARVITGADGPEDTDVPRWVTVDDGRISAVGTKRPSSGQRVDLGPLQLWPAFTDLHADSLPRFESPRAGTIIPLEAALQDFTADAVAHGVVHPYLCVSVGEPPAPVDGYFRAHAVLQRLDRIADALAVKVLVHLRVDVSDPQSCEGTAELLKRYGDQIGLISVMDHTPGQGQYRTESAWRPAMRARLGLGDEELDQWLTSLHKSAVGTASRRRHIAQLAALYSKVLAAHDTDTFEDVADAVAMKARICEFPLALHAAAAARDTGIVIVMGAPNAWRGASHMGNISARDAIAAGLVDALASDYHTGSLARAAVAVAKAQVSSIDSAVAMLTTRPRRVVAPSDADTGALVPGQVADMIAVRTEPVVGVVATWSAGRQISGPALV